MNNHPISDHEEEVRGSLLVPTTTMGFYARAILLAMSVAVVVSYMDYREAQADWAHRTMLPWEVEASIAAGEARVIEASGAGTVVRTDDRLSLCQQSNATSSFSSCQPLLAGR